LDHCAGPRIRFPDWRPRRHRAGVQPERHRPAVRAGRHPQRFHPDAGHRDADCSDLHRHQSDRGYPLRLSRSTHSLWRPLMAAADTALAARAPRRPSVILDFAKSQPIAALSFLFILALVFSSTFADYVAPYDPLALDFENILGG